MSENINSIGLRVKREGLIDFYNFEDNVIRECAFSMGEYKYIMRGKFKFTIRKRDDIWGNQFQIGCYSHKDILIERELRKDSVGKNNKASNWNIFEINLDLNSGKAFVKALYDFFYSNGGF